MTYGRAVALTILLFGFASTTWAATATWDRNPEPDVTGYLLSYGTQSGQHTTSIDVGNVVTYTLSLVPGQRYYIVVQAYNANGARSLESSEVVYDAPAGQNQPPVFTQPANQTSAQNAPASLALSATDPEHSALSYSATGLPAGLTINSATGVISGSPTTAGTFTVSASVSDQQASTTRTFTWTITAAGSGTTATLSPSDTSISIDNNNYATDPRLYTYTYPANRIANAILMKFDLSQIPANATISSATLMLSLIAADTATADPTYSVSLHRIINRNPDLARATGRSADGVNDWTANNCCYQNDPMAQADISAAQSTLAVDRTLGVKSWDALAVVQAWRATPSTNFGLLLNSDPTKPTDRFRYFASMEYPTVSQRPVLRVTYSVTGTTGDTTAPAVSLTAPQNNATVVGASVTVSATASDAVGVSGVQFRLDGAAIGAEDTVSPYSTVWNSTTAPNGSHVLTAVARDAAGNSRTSTAVTVTVNNPAANSPPTLAQPANQTGTQNAAASLALSATDPDGNVLSYSATGLPAGLSINSATGLISGSPTTAGTFTVSATASDQQASATRTFTWTVTAAGGGTTVAISPTDTTINLDNNNYASDQRLGTYTYPANRIANAILMKFDLSQIPANATVTSATLMLSLIEADGVTSDPTYSVSLHQIVNRNPDLARATGQSADGVNAWTASSCCYQGIPLAQADISAAQSTLAVDRTLGVKSWDALTAVQSWRATPSTNFGLLLNSDPSKPSDRYRFFASMENPTVSQRPVLRVTYSVTGTTGDTTAPVVSLTAPQNSTTVSGSAITVSATASDTVGVSGVQFRLDGAIVGTEDTTSPYSIVWNSTTVANGSHVLTAVARDAAGNSRTSAAVTVTVNNAPANGAPTLSQPSNQTSAEGTAVSITLVATDPERSALTYSASGLPAGLSVAASTGVISGTPTFSSAGTYTVTATASDGSLSSTRSFSWVVTNTNRAPVLALPASQVGAAGDTVSVQLSASDADGTALTYQAANLPPGLAINASTGLISGTLTSAAPGTYDVNASVSDGQLNAVQVFSWSVGGADVPISGDFDGDGRPDLASFRPSTGEWRIWRSGQGFAASAPIQWGVSTDLPVVADYDGDRKSDIAFYRPSTGTWQVLFSSTNMQSGLQIQWGAANDRPLAIDYDNDGKADLVLPRFGGFVVLLSSSNYVTVVTIR